MEPTPTVPGGAFRATVERGGIRVPAAVVAALEAGRRPLLPHASRFESLAYGRRRWFTLDVEDAKTPEPRGRRIERAVARLREGG